MVAHKRSPFNEEPFEDDSVSVAHNKNKRYKKKEERREDETKSGRDTQLLVKEYEF